MRIVIEPAGELFRLAARRVAREIQVKPSCVLGLATGRTMLPLYDELVQLHRSEGLSFAQVTAFNLDEYVGVDPEQPGSFRHFMRVQLLERTNLPAASLHLPSASERDAGDVARDYEARIQAAGGIDLQLLGLGVNAHIGFNEPGSSLGSRTRVKTLSEETLASTTGPRMAITMGLGTILDARCCLLIATGSAKAAAVAATVEGPLTASAPASVLQLHPEVIAYVDEAASAQLSRRRYYLEAEALQRRLEGEGASSSC